MDFATKKEELIKKGQELTAELDSIQIKANKLNLEIIKINGKIEMCDEELNSVDEL